MPRVIGLTGNIACGKTIVGHMLLELGIERYIDADVIVHALYQSGQPIAMRVAEIFGATIVAPDGSIDRAALGTVVFQDAEAMQALEAIVHPAVQAFFAQEVTSVGEKGIVAIDAVKLLEGKANKFCQSIWLIVCSEQQQVSRLRLRNHLSEEATILRLRAQPPVAGKLGRFDEIIDNSNSLEETRQQVLAAFDRFRQRFPARP